MYAYYTVCGGGSDDFFSGGVNIPNSNGHLGVIGPRNLTYRENVGRINVSIGIFYERKYYKLSEFSRPIGIVWRWRMHSSSAGAGNLASEQCTMHSSGATLQQTSTSPSKVPLTALLDPI